MNNSDRVYQEMIQKSMKSISAEINKLERQNRGLRAATDNMTVKIDGLKLQLQELNQELKNYEERITLSERKENKLDKTDAKVAEIIAKEESHVQKIRDLENMKKSLHTTRAVRKVNKQIVKQQEIIKRLQKKNARIDLRQKVIMMPKYYRVKKRSQLLNKQQAKVNLAIANIHDVEMMKSMLDPENKIMDNLKSVIYDIKGAYYQKKLSHAQDVLETMQHSKSNIAIRGANAITLSKKAVNKLRKNNGLKKETAIDLVNAKEQENQTMTTALSTVVR